MQLKSFVKALWNKTCGANSFCAFSILNYDSFLSNIKLLPKASLRNLYHEKYCPCAIPAAKKVCVTLIYATSETAPFLYHLKT